MALERRPLAAARNAVLARAGWDVEARGLIGAPPLRVFTSAESHATVFNALRLLGLGRDTAVRVDVDGEGRIRADALAAALAAGRAEGLSWMATRRLADPRPVGGLSGRDYRWCRRVRADSATAPVLSPLTP